MGEIYSSYTIKRGIGQWEPFHNNQFLNNQAYFRQGIQCDQIGQFLNILVTIFFLKSSPNICVTFGTILENGTFQFKNSVD